MKVEVAVLGSQSLISLMVSADVKRNLGSYLNLCCPLDHDQSNWPSTELLIFVMGSSVWNGSLSLMAGLDRKVNVNTVGKPRSIRWRHGGTGQAGVILSWTV